MTLLIRLASFRLPRQFTCAVLILLAGLLATRNIASAQTTPLSEESLKKVKHATVYLRVKLANGSITQGTGWFIEPGILITNAHVLGMLGEDSPKPRIVEAVIDSGEATSKALPAKFLGADPDADLALLSVEGENLPEPLKLGATTGLGETQEVYIFGFPYGKDLGKNITVGKSSITSLRKDNGGLLKEIQVNGGMHPGNSGGPVTNDRGEVIGVAVRAVQGTLLNFAIPADRVSALLNGRVTGFSTDLAVLDGGQMKIPVRIRVLDPLKRIKALQLEYWVGTKAKNRLRPKSFTRPEPAEGDGETKIMKVEYDGKPVAYVEAPVPPLSADTACYWIRPRYVDGANRPVWHTTIGNLRPIPVERKEVTLNFQPKAGPTTPLQLTNDSSFKVQIRGIEENTSMHLRVIMNPTILPPGTEGDIHSKVRFSTVTLGMKVNGVAVNAKEELGPIGEGILKTSADIEYDDEGAVVQSQFDLSKADPKLKEMMGTISDHLLQSIELLSVPLPNGTIRPMEKVRAKPTLLVGLPGMFLPAQADIKYQYLGVRTRKDGRQTAMFEMNGTLRPRRGDDGKIGGKISGTAEFLIATGELYAGKSEITLDMELGEPSKNLRLLGSLNVDFRQASVAAPKEEESKPGANTEQPKGEGQKSVPAASGKG
jgi:S1-C subfamily serine protease